MATKSQVIDLHAANPTWTARDIADALGCLSAYVRATAQRNGLRSPHHHRGPGEAARRLRRAAPDLLRAAMAVEAVMAQHVYPQPDKPDSAWAKLVSLRAAINMATGESAQ